MRSAGRLPALRFFLTPMILICIMIRINYDEENVMKRLLVFMMALICVVSMSSCSKGVSEDVEAAIRSECDRFIDAYAARRNHLDRRN